MKSLWIIPSKSALPLALVLLMFLIIPASAVEYTVGVKEGDWVKYGEISVSWNGTGTEPQSVKDAKQMDWVKVEVQSVSGTTVSMTTTSHYKNGTDTPQTDSYDVKSGQGTGGFFFVIIAANLKKGDPITTQPNAPTINDTVTRTYAGASRSVNVLDVTFTSGSYTMKYVCRWDKATGIWLEVFTRQPDNPFAPTGAYVDYSVKATETNIWTADSLGIISSNLPFIAIIVAAIVVIIVGIFIAKRKKPAPTVTPTPAPQEEKP